jgi:hypothetical protein
MTLNPPIVLEVHKEVQLTDVHRLICKTRTWHLTVKTAEAARDGTDDWVPILANLINTGLYDLPSCSKPSRITPTFNGGADRSVDPSLSFQSPRK